MAERVEWWEVRVSKQEGMRPTAITYRDSITDELRHSDEFKTYGDALDFAERVKDQGYTFEIVHCMPVRKG